MRTINIVPSARVQPTTWNWIGHVAFNDRVPTQLDLASVPPTADGVSSAGWLIAGQLILVAGVGLVGQAWGRGATTDDTVVRRRAVVDSNLGWWLCVAGLAMVSIQMAIFTLR
jgi:hypothetical protein